MPNPDLVRLLPNAGFPLIMSDAFSAMAIDDGRIERVAARELDEAARARAQMIGIEGRAIAAGHRADTFLDAGTWQEVELQIGRLLAPVAPPEGTALDQARGDGSGMQQQILHTGNRLPVQLLVLVIGVGPIELPHDVARHVILQIPPDTRQIMLDGDAFALEMCGGADA